MSHGGPHEETTTPSTEEGLGFKETFVPGGQAVPKQTSTMSSLSGFEKGVWFQRPTPVTISPSKADWYVKNPDLNNPHINTWYDKADVDSYYGRMGTQNPQMQMLYEAVAEDMGHNKSGSGVFQDMVDQSAYLSTDGVRKTPDQLLLEVAYQRGILGENGQFKAPGGSGSGGPKTTTSTSRSVSLTDNDTAHAVLDQALSTYLGRRASEDELSSFVNSLHKHERKNARVTTTTATTGGGSTSSSSVTRGGSNSQQYAVDYARAQEGSAEYQAATDFMDEFISAIKNPMDVVS